MKMSSYSRQISSQQTASDQMWFAVGFLAKISRQWADAWASRATALASGNISPQPLAQFHQDTQSWRTSQLSIFEDLDKFSQTLPRSGMTRNGTLFLLPHLAPRTSANAAGLLPTPRVSRGFTNPTLLKPRPDCLTSRLLGMPVLGKRPRPQFVEWMMGFPIGWSELRSLETPSCPRSPNSSDARSSKRKKTVHEVDRPARSNNRRSHKL